ncbi:MAG: hypothetical protein Q9159_004676 [Coniocarpon cinnabarinum]
MVVSTLTIPKIAPNVPLHRTERAGGSSVSNTETRAYRLETDSVEKVKRPSGGSPLGQWGVDGFKWFSSATDVDMTVLAKTYDPSKNTEALSAFFAPSLCLNSQTVHSHRSKTVTNGVFLQRLKNKLGTKPLPTVDLELKCIRAYLLGQLGHGVREISTVLNITRVHNSMSAMGNWGRGLAIARAWARSRQIGKRLLMDIRAHVRDMAQEHIKYRAYMLFAFFVVVLLGVVEHHADTGNFSGIAGVQSAEHAAQLLRLLTPVLKAKTALVAIDGLRWVIESLRGISYLKNEDPVLNVARILRDTVVLTIWEGTTNITAEGTMRVLQRQETRANSVAFGTLKQ